MSEADSPVKNIKIECIVASYTPGITKTFSKDNVLAGGDHIEQMAGFTNQDILAGMLSGTKNKDKISNQDIKFKWTIDCIGADNKCYTFVKSSHL